MLIHFVRSKANERMVIMLFIKKSVPKNEYHRTVIMGGKTFLFRTLWEDISVERAKKIAKIIVDYSRERSDITLALLEKISNCGGYSSIEFVTKSLQDDLIEIYLAWPKKEEPE